MIEYINISNLFPHPDNPRKDLGDLTELSESIKHSGILQNLTVVAIKGAGSDGQYCVVIGHRRLAAAKLAGLTEVPCIISNMDPREQMATMLVENMQRNDLTLWEQANGFQLMINFGDSANEIAKKTGLSKTTVNRRVKLLELDQDKLRESMGRNVGIEDFEKLNKIKDINARNEVLGEIGTKNFEWKLKAALDSEKNQKNKAKVIEKLNEFATEVEDKSNYITVKWLYYGQSTDIEKPEDAGEKDYFYFVDKYYIYLLVEKSEDEKPDEKTEENTSDDSKKRKTDEQERKERIEQLKELTGRAYQLRLDFVKRYHPTKKQSKDLMELLVKTMADDLLYLEFDRELFAEILELEPDEDVDEDEDGEFEFTFDDVEFILASGKSLERVFFVLTYCIMGDGDRKYYFDTWSGAFRANQELDCIYNSLVSFGYGMSDEEKALRNGTHELFLKVEGEE